MREQLEHRVLWLYLLCDEANKKGLSWKEFGGTSNLKMWNDSWTQYCEKR